MVNNSNPLFYSGTNLDRATELRKNPAWLKQQKHHPKKSVVPVWKMLHLVSQTSEPGIRAIRFYEHRAQQLHHQGNMSILLGLENDLPVFVVDVSEQEQSPIDSPDTQWLDLRQCGPLLSQQDAGLLAYARAMVHWHASHQFCGYCGAPTKSAQGGHIRSCQNRDCARDGFPRTDPAVIMRIEHQLEGSDQASILLGRQSRWPEGAYSVLAGFVDPGESLEQAVAREVFEEAGVRITDIIYQGSQPWPFPSSLMLGFKARAVDSKLNFSSHELQHAAWFSAKQVLSFGEWGDSGSGLRLPRRDSISRRLIDDWLYEVGLYQE
ncbi:MAG TPA: NAD(+) diphosphatase [Gammaproteobacteria bacterium]|nr:NAD(+) diphosphatase [Gammaproteobacteria bacterium]